MNWQRLHDELYYVDGTWRDIYVKEITEDDWRNWIIFVNDNYEVEFYNGLKQATEKQIDFKTVSDYWAGKHPNLSCATFLLDGIKINCRNFFLTEIENDFDPKEIDFITNHETIIKYMSNVSKLLNKTVVMTPENLPSQPYVSVSNSVVKIITG